MDKSEQNWNYKITQRIIKWLCKHKQDQYRIAVVYESTGTTEIRVYPSPDSSKTIIYIRACGCADLIVDVPRKTGMTRCYCYAELRDTIKDWLKEELDG